MTGNKNFSNTTRDLYSSGYLENILDERITFGVIKGVNSAVSTSFETIWEEGGLYQFPVSSSTMTISSDNVNDDSGGTGAITIAIGFLDSDYKEKIELVNLNGVTPVTSINSILRINSITLVNAGSNLNNVGNIYIGTGTVTAGKPANVFGLIPVGTGQSQTAVFTVPANKNLTERYSFVSSEVNKQLNYQTSLFNIFGNNEKIITAQFFMNGGGTPFDPNPSPVAGPKTDIRFDAKVPSGTDVASFLTQFSLVDL